MKRKRKRITGILIGMMLAAVMLGGCGQKKEETDVKEEIDTKKTEVHNQEQMEGTLARFGGGEIDIENVEGEYTFDITQASIKTAKLRSGDEIIVHYEGEIKGTDTSGVKVTSVEDLGNSNEDREEKQAVGVLTDMSMNTVTIRQNDGTELTFSSNNCRHEFRNGIREGNWIVVTYVGDIKGTNTQNVSVISITDNDENKSEEAKSAMNIQAVDEKVYATAGVHVRASYSIDSAIVGSLKMGDSIQRTGVCENGWSRVVFDNKDAYIYGDYLTKEAPKADAKPAKTDGQEPKTPQTGNEPMPVKQPTTQAAETQTAAAQVSETQAAESQPDTSVQQKIIGTVVDASMNTLTITAEDGQRYTLNIMDAQHEYANGIQTGNIVTITYEGNLSDMENVIVVKVQDEDPNTAAQNAVYEGTIIDGTMNTVTIETDDGAMMTFLKRMRTIRQMVLKMG